MLDWLLGFFSDLVDWFVGVLPASPFQGLVLGLSGDELQWLGWINWVVPVGDMLDLLMVWLVAALAVGAAFFSGSMISRISQLFFGK